MLLEGGHTVCQGQRLSLHYFWVFGALHNACYMVDVQCIFAKRNEFMS